MQSEGKAAFYARKRALKQHMHICNDQFCHYCQFAKNISNFQFIVSSLSRYNFGLRDLSQIKIYNSPKKVKFCKSIDQHKVSTQKGYHLNYVTVLKAFEHNLSFEELALLQPICWKVLLISHIIQNLLSILPYN